MTEKEKIQRAYELTEEIVQLLKGNEYEQYMLLKLNGVYYELQRQLSHFEDWHKGGCIPPFLMPY